MKLLKQIVVGLEGCSVQLGLDLELVVSESNSYLILESDLNPIKYNCPTGRDFHPIPKKKPKKDSRDIWRQH